MRGHVVSMDDVLAIHSVAITRFGGVDGVRDEGMLESALAQPFQTFADTELYPDPTSKACRYAYGIIKDHPFTDGNKRTATAVMGAYLRMSGVDFKPDHGELLSAMLGVADGSWDFDKLLSWVRDVTA